MSQADSLEKHYELKEKLNFTAKTYAPQLYLLH